ncbi:DUF3073 domain-containing protein [Agrococcus baldri]|uniref:DUF3073 domain-containing protein n=1 Tax=Agrococcus baldri TaxID=153730 RepID=A0AA87RAH2_9MICO|nr:DUF3073 domain-containing protein [Agrococcus baldri]GEK79281.1 hypothetical protein ABA31_06320 [Agrococcus baldri]
MGRGRQKAKHTKIARELKSYSPDVNYNALQAELGGGTATGEVDKWADYAEYESSDDDYADEYQTGRTA